jgi:hypothetical protein
MTCVKINLRENIVKITIHFKGHDKSDLYPP